MFATFAQAFLRTASLWIFRATFDQQPEAHGVWKQESQKRPVRRTGGDRNEGQWKQREQSEDFWVDGLGSGKQEADRICSQDEVK